MHAESNLYQKYPEVVTWLREQGHSDPEIEKILNRLEVHDQAVKADSLMDSIENGNFDIESIIQEALAEMDDPQ